MSPLGLTADTDIAELLPLVDSDRCPQCAGRLFRPDLLVGDRAFPAPFLACIECGTELPDEDPEVF